MRPSLYPVAFHLFLTLSRGRLLAGKEGGWDGWRNAGGRVAISDVEVGVDEKNSPPLSFCQKHLIAYPSSCGDRHCPHIHTCEHTLARSLSGTSLDKMPVYITFPCLLTAATRLFGAVYIQKHTRHLYALMTALAFEVDLDMTVHTSREIEKESNPTTQTIENGEDEGTWKMSHFDPKKSGEGAGGKKDGKKASLFGKKQRKILRQRGDEMIRPTVTKKVSLLLLFTTCITHFL